MYGYNNQYGSSSYGSSRFEEFRPPEKSQPLDTVSSIVWDPYHSNPAFFTSSWDGFVRYYVVNSGSNSSFQVQLGWQMFLQHPVLCCDINRDKIMFVGMSTGDVAAIKMENNQLVRMGGHDAPVCGIFWIHQKGCLMTLGFDDMIKFWTLDGGDRPQMEVRLPLKTHTCHMDWPMLLIGSAQSTVSLVNLKNLPNANFPTHPNDYYSASIQRFSKFNCSRILANEANKAILGTVDGRFVTFGFKDNLEKITPLDVVVSKVQKKTQSRYTLYGQVNGVDLGYYSYESFALVGGTQNLQSYNIAAKNKIDVLSSNTTSIGATTAVRMSPRLDFIAYATGSDWAKGIHQLEHIKRPIISVIKFGMADVKRLTSRP